MPQVIPADAQDLIKRALATDQEARISAKEFIEHEWFVKHGLYRKRATVTQEADANLEFQRTQNFSSRNMANPANPLMARLGSRSVSREPTAHKEQGSFTSQAHTFTSQAQTPKVQIFTNTAPAFFPKPLTPTPDMASLPNAQPTALYQQLRNENSSFNQTTQGSFVTSSPMTPVRMNPPKTDYSLQTAHDTSSMHLQTDKRNNESTEVVSTEMNRVRKTPTLQLKPSAKGQDSIKFHHAPTITSVNPEVKRVQPEALIFTQASTPSLSSHQQPGIVISSNRHQTGFQFDALENSQSGARADASPIRRAYGDRNTPVKDAIIHAREASPTPTVPHGHGRQQASPDVSAISSSKDPYRPLLTYTSSTPAQLPASNRYNSDRDAYPRLTQTPPHCAAPPGRPPAHQLGRPRRPRPAACHPEPHQDFEPRRRVLRAAGRGPGSPAQSERARSREPATQVQAQQQQLRDEHSAVRAAGTQEHPQAPRLPSRLPQQAKAAASGQRPNRRNFRVHEEGADFLLGDSAREESELVRSFR